VPLEEHRTSVVKRGKRTTKIYRWLSGVPLRGTNDALSVNWFSIETRNDQGKRTYFNSFVTDLEIVADTVAELAACGRARWKIENETFNVLKTNGYNLEHNFGHGRQTLASFLVVLNLLAFAFHTVAMLAVLAWRQAMAARGPNPSTLNGTSVRDIFYGSLFGIAGIQVAVLNKIDSRSQGALDDVFGIGSVAVVTG